MELPNLNFLQEHLGPIVSNLIDLGSSVLRWRSIWTKDLDISGTGTVARTPTATTDIANKAYVDAGNDLTVAEVDGVPSLLPVNVLKFDQADGFVVTNPSGSIARIDLAAIPSTALATVAAAQGGTGLTALGTANQMLGMNTTAASLVYQDPLALNVKTYGAIGDGATDDTTAIQAAINAATLAQTVFFPSGTYKVTSALTIANGMQVCGTNAGAQTGSAVGATITTTSVAADIFTVTTLDPVIFKDFMLTTSVVKTTSAGINFNPASGTNNRSRIINVRLNKMYYGVWVKTGARNWVIRDCFIDDYVGTGIYVQNTTAGNLDAGDNLVHGCTIWDLNNAASDNCIRYDDGGALTISDNKLLGSAYGIRMLLQQGPAGTLIIHGNSIESQRTLGISLEQGVTGKLFAHVIINSNQFLQQVQAGFQSNISISAGISTPWISDIAITGNIIRNANNFNFAQINLNDGNNVTVTGNVIDSAALANPSGISVGTNATNVTIAGNTIVSAAGKQYNQIKAATSVSHPQVIQLSSIATIAQATTTYLGQGGNGAESGSQLFYLPYKCRVLRMFTTASTSPVGAQSFIYTLRVNGVATTLTTTVSGGNTDGQDVTNSVAVPAPDGPSTAARCSIQIVTSATAAAASHSVTIEVIPEI